METRVLFGEHLVCCVPVHKSLLSVRSLCAQLLVVQSLEVTLTRRGDELVVTSCADVPILSGGCVYRRKAQRIQDSDDFDMVSAALRAQAGRRGAESPLQPDELRCSGHFQVLRRSLAVPCRRAVALRGSLPAAAVLRVPALRPGRPAAA